MTEFKQYRRTQIAEMTEWGEQFDMNGVSVSAEDTKAGSPKIGDMIARNPANHKDKWLVAAAYFAANFEPTSDTVGNDKPSDYVATQTGITHKQTSIKNGEHSPPMTFDEHVDSIEWRDDEDIQSLIDRDRE